MNLKDKISDLKQRISITENVLSNHKINYEKLINAKEYSSKDIIKDIELKESNLVVINIIEDYYEYILGGDGRSQPWSENRKGKVCSVILYDQTYIPDEEKSIIEKYLLSTRDINKVEFK